MVTIDGKDLTRRLRHLLNLESGDPFLDSRTSYDFLYAAARQWVIETECLTAYQEITTVADQAGYTLNGDYLSLYLKEDDRFFIKFYDGTDYYFIFFKPYAEVIYDNNTDSVAIPSYFTITDDPTLDTIISDTADNAADDVGGKTVLTMDTAVFTDVTSGDIIHNTTDVSDGVVVKVTSTKIIEICLFGGTDNEIGSGDAFIIQPRKRMRILFDPPPSTKDYTATVYYLQKPDPVYSDYDVYKIAYDYPDALVQYAAWLYKYRDKEANFGDAFYVYWRRMITEARRLTFKGFVKEESRIIPVVR